MRKLVAMLVVLLFAGLSVEVQGALLAYEGFDTTDGDGTELPSFGGGDTSTGWSGNWVTINDFSPKGQGITVNNPGLSYGSLTTVGKLADSNIDGSSDGHYGRELSQSYTVGSGQKSEIWVSWLSTWLPGKTLQWLTLRNNGNPVDRAGVNNWGGNYGSETQDEWMLNTGNGDNPKNRYSGVAAESNTVYQLGMRLSEDGGDTLVELFVNSGGDRQRGSALASHTLTGAVTFDEVALQSLNNAGNPPPGPAYAEWDEIRIGDSYADVGLIPEPASIAVLGLTGLLFWIRRKMMGK